MKVILLEFTFVYNKRKPRYLMEIWWVVVMRNLILLIGKSRFLRCSMEGLFIVPHTLVVIIGGEGNVCIFVICEQLQLP